MSLTGHKHRRTSQDRGPFAIVPGFLIVASPSAIKVYVALALHADHDTGECWPSHRKLSHDTGLSKATVRRCIDELSAIGALTVIHRATEDGNQTSNLYRLSFAVNKPVDNGVVMNRGVLMGEQGGYSPVSTEPEPDEPYIASLVEKMPREVGEAIEDYLRRLSEAQRG